MALKKPYHSIAYKGIVFKYIVAFIIGLGVGFRYIPNPVMSGMYILLCAICLYFALRENLDKLFMVLPFVCYTEVYMRGYIKSMPYLMVEYLYLAMFGFLILKHLKDKKAHSHAYILMIVFALMELLNGLFPDDARLFKPIIINSYAFIVVIVWSSFNRLSPQLIHRLLTYLKIAAVYLTGVVLVAHLRGGISYNTESNFGSSNGMAPVQLSGYLGLGSILLIFSFLNPEEAKYRWLNIILFTVCTTVMILTFSRGGLYFLGVIIILYAYFNKASLGSYVKFLFIIPFGILIYYFVINQTQGTIAKRYQKKGSSNRDVLVMAGFKLFLDDPVIGVGTSNYSTQVVKRRYFDQVSTAHNEFVRAIAEHGIIGLVTYWGFFIATFINIWRRHGPQKEFSLYFLVLFCLIVVHNGLKISIQHLLVMMAVANPNVEYIRYKLKHVRKSGTATSQLQTS